MVYRVSTTFRGLGLGLQGKDRVMRVRTWFRVLGHGLEVGTTCVRTWFTGSVWGLGTH